MHQVDIELSCEDRHRSKTTDAISRNSAHANRRAQIGRGRQVTFDRDDEVELGDIPNPAEKFTDVRLVPGLSSTQLMSVEQDPNQCQPPAGSIGRSPRSLGNW